MTFTEADLLSLLTALAQPDARIERLGLNPEGIGLEAGYNLLGLEIEVRLKGQLAVREGRLVAELVEVMLNNTEAPPVVRHQLAGLAAKLADRLNSRVEFDHLELGAGYLQLGGRYRPRQ